MSNSAPVVLAALEGLADGHSQGCCPVFSELRRGPGPLGKECRERLPLLNLPLLFTASCVAPSSRKPRGTWASWLQPRPSFKLPDFILSRGRPYLLYSMHGVGDGSGQEGSRPLQPRESNISCGTRAGGGPWLGRTRHWDLGPEKSSFPFFFFHCSWMCILIRIIVSKYNRSFSSLKYNVIEPSLLRYKEPLTHIEGALATGQHSPG